jgi:hypothetical protein
MGSLRQAARGGPSGVRPSAAQLSQPEKLARQAVDEEVGRVLSAVGARQARSGDI